MSEIPPPAEPLLAVCAWCERYLGARSPRVTVTHGICPTCAARQRWKEPHTLVVSRSKSDLVPVLRDLLRGAPEIRVVLDRRLAERRRAERKRAPVDLDAERRRADRRRAGGLQLE